MNSLSFGNTETILRASHIYRQRTFFKKWKKSWLVIYFGGTIQYFKGKKSERPQKTFNLKNDCITIKTGKQCRHLLPPKDVATDFLIEIILTGERSLKFCAPDKENFMLWMAALRRCISDKALPKPKHERRNLRPEEVDQLEEESCWFCCLRKNTVEAM